MTSAATPSWLVDVPLAHRGLHGPGVPENSLAAFDAACRAGVGMELDVRLTADGVPVVCHDLSLRRVTGHVFRVDQLSLEVLSGLRLLGADEPVPTLAAVLELVGDRAPIMVEVKNESLRAGRVEAATAALLDRHAGPIVVASFNPMTVRWFARNRPAVLRAQTGGVADVPAAVDRLLKRALRHQVGAPDLVSWNVDHLDDAVVVALREAGVPVTCWTVRTEDDLARARAGADNLIFEGLSPAQVSR